MPTTPEKDLTSADGLWEDTVAEKMRHDFPASMDTVDDVWRAATQTRHLSPRMVELVLLGMHASASSMNEEAITRHVDRAKVAGATDADVVDVLMTIAGVATHALYASLPVLLDELASAGVDRTSADPVEIQQYEAAKQAFLKVRGGFWNPGRDIVADVMPRFAEALIKQSAESWNSGSLTVKEREFVCLAIDATVNHLYESGLRLHLGKAIAAGASVGELIEVLQLAALLGLEGFIVGVPELFKNEEATDQ